MLPGQNEGGGGEGAGVRRRIDRLKNRNVHIRSRRSVE